MKILVDDPESLVSHLAQSNLLSDSCLPGSQEKTQTQMRSVWPLPIRENLVWASDTSQGAHMRGTEDSGWEKLCFATFATILCKMRHQDLALVWQLLWNVSKITPNFKCLTHSFVDWLTNSSSGRQRDENCCSSCWSELRSPQLLGGAPAPALEYWLFAKSCQAQGKLMSHPLPVFLLL